MNKVNAGLEKISAEQGLRNPWEEKAINGWGCFFCINGVDPL
jgi:hypothetical protein